MSTSPKAVLLVEDDPGIQEIYHTILSMQGYDVKGVTTGEEALAEIERGQAHFLLLDLLIPGISGLEVLKTIRTDPKFQNASAQLKVVVLTNVSDSEMTKEVKRLGVDKYLIKAEIAADDLPKILKTVDAAPRAKTNTES